MIQNLQAMVDGIQRKTLQIPTQTSREKLPVTLNCQICPQIKHLSTTQTYLVKTKDNSYDYFHTCHRPHSASSARLSGREDLKTWFEVLELDDYVSYGGNA